MATQTIRIVITENGAQAAANRIRTVGQSAKQASSAVLLFRRTLGFIGATALIKGIANLSDEFINVENRLKTVSPSFADARFAMDELRQVANETRSDFAATAETFARLASSSKSLGFSQSNLLGVSKSLNEAIILSGATARESRTALIQLSQGFARGVLRGDELRSVLEQLPAVADVIAKQLGVARFDLARLGEQGKITSTIIIEAFIAAREELESRFAKTIPTIGQAFTVFKNDLVFLIGEFNRSTGASEKFARGIIALGSSLGTLVNLVQTVATAAFIQFAGRALVSVSTGMLTVATSATRMGLAIRGAVGLLPTLGLLAVASFIGFADQIKLGTDEVTTFGDVGTVVMNGFKEVVADVARGIFDIGKAAGEAKGPLREFTEGAVKTGASLFRAIGLGRTVDAVKAIRDAAIAQGQLRVATEALGEQENFLARRRAENEAKRAAAQPTRLDERFAEEVRRLKAENVALASNTDERRANLAALSVLNKFKGELGPTREKVLADLVAENEALARQNKLLEDIKGPQLDFNQNQADLKILLDKGDISLQQFTNTLRDFRLASLKDDTSFGAGITRGVITIRKEIEDMSKLSETAMTNAFKGAEDALVEFVQTGKLSFGDLVNSITEDLTRIAVRQAIIQPLAGLLFPEGGGGAGGFLGSLFGSGGNFLSGLFGGTPAAANGLDMTVGGSGGTDSQMVAFRATPGERVIVENSEGRTGGSGGGTTVNFNISSNDPDAFGRSVGQLTARAMASANRANRRDG